MKLSVVIPAYNDLNGVLTCLNSLQALAAGEVEYIVQDDCSPNVFFPAVIPDSVADVQRNATNQGFAGNCNAGAARASGDVLLFCNQDVYGVHGWSGGWDLALLSAFENPRVGVVGARLLFPNGTIQSAGGLIDGGGAPFHRCLNYSNLHHAEISTPRTVSWVTGAALAIRADLFWQIGGFNTHYVGGYFEDVELCLRARELGLEVWYAPQCTLMHSVGSTGGNPHFAQNAQTFKRAWVDTAKVKPDVPYTAVRYW